ncbi:capsule biosynthesis GfcC family protein [Escherichia coli]
MAYWNKRHVEPMPGSVCCWPRGTPSGVRRLMPLTPTFFRLWRSGYLNNEKKTSA